MFLPQYFRVTDSAQIVDLIRQNSLGIMVTNSGSESEATHMPFLVDNNLGELKGHMAAANNQWKGLDGKRVLVIFQGPNHYISPDWYGEKMQVPTWNYAIAHIRGTLHLLKNEDEKIALLDEMVSHYEESEGEGWSADWSRKEYLSMLSGIVAFRIAIDTVEGKWKLSQNHPGNAVKNVADKLSGMPGKNAEDVGGLMRKAKFSGKTREK